MSAQPSALPDQSRTSIRLACPRCRRDFDATVDSTQHQQCAGCGFVLYRSQGIWDALPSDRVLYYSRFMSEYERVRSAEARGSDAPEFYLALPYATPDNPLKEQWKIRAISYESLEANVLHCAPLDVLDLGAGNGWLSYRLALRGHRPIAVDLLANTSDGLGAAQHFISALPAMFPCVRAEVDRLPFVSAQFDLAIFNASFHYSENHLRTFGEALRCVKPGGKIAIVDTPWYSSDDSGERMIRERQLLYTARFGFPSDALHSIEYVTPDRLSQIEQQFGVAIRTLRPWYGVEWAARPLIARLRGKRRPSEFRIFIAEVPAQ